MLTAVSPMSPSSGGLLGARESCGSRTQGVGEDGASRETSCPHLYQPPLSGSSWTFVAQVDTVTIMQPYSALCTEGAECSYGYCPSRASAAFLGQSRGAAGGQGAEGLANPTEDWKVLVPSVGCVLYDFLLRAHLSLFLCLFFYLI